MSERAREYYTRAARHYGFELPDLLASGSSIQLSSDSLPIHLRDSEIWPDLDRLERAFSRQINWLRPFVMSVARAKHPGAPEKDAIFRESSLWDKLKPKKLKAGFLYDFRMEPLAPEEVGETVRARIRAAQKDVVPRPLHDAEAVYVITSAALHAGRELGRVACVSQLYMPCTRDDAGEVTALVGVPKVTTVPLRTNELLVRSALADSRAIATIVALHRQSQPPFPGNFENNR